MTTPLQVLIQNLEQKKNSFFVANDPKLHLAISSTINEAQGGIWREKSFVKAAMEFSRIHPEKPIEELLQLFYTQENFNYEGL